MSTKIFSCFVDGLSANLIEVEVDILQGLPGLSIVGLGDTAVQEAKERIRSAIKNSGATYPQQKKIINLAPAHLRKNGACFDMPMALGLLEASRQLKAPPNALIVGELALNGEVRPIHGALSIGLFAQKHHMDLFLPYENASEVQIIDYPNVYPVKNFAEIIKHCQAKEPNESPLQKIPTIAKNQNLTKETSDSLFQKGATAREQNSSKKPEPAELEPPINMSMIQGQLTAKRALEIAAAGGHHVLLYGPPGTGKTLLAQALQGILPPLTKTEMIEIMQIYSSAGLLKNPEQLHQRPFRQIHQSCSTPALVGGGIHAQPGEISLAHHGVLFFDEIAEAPRSLLESLRQPLEERSITVSRLHHHVVYPANFTLIAAMNPCPCGYYGSEEKSCTCTNSAIVHYHKKLSGPLMDRFQLFVQLQREPVKLQTPSNQKTSQEFQKDIIKVRQIQQKRFQNMHRPMLNSQINAEQIKEFCSIESQSQKYLFDYANAHKVSMRSLHNILKIARTIADLNAHDNIQTQHIAEALSYRLQPTSPLI